MPPLKNVSSQNPRQIAAEVLRQRRGGGDFTENLLANTLDQAGLLPVDRALCQELVYGVVRWRATLDWLIARRTDRRKPRPILQNLLRLGLYQIFWLERIPAHAAVHETVELARQTGLGAQAGFVNAMLRGYLREAEATRRLLAELKISHPALAWSHPEWLVARWQKHWGAEKTAQLLQWNNTPPKTFARLNLLKMSEAGSARCADRTPQRGVPAKIGNAGALLAQWREEGVEYGFVRRNWLDENLVFELKAHPPLTKVPSFQRGFFYLQDPSTLLAVMELNPQAGETILDFCAAPGGKTTLIAQWMNNQGRIVAQDVSGERLQLIQENCTRLGVTCVKTVLPSTLGSRSSAGFDRILVDAPCSNTGAMRRRVDLRWRIQQGEISRLQRTQLALLDQAAPWLKPDGVLVYSTCSLESEENQGVVEQFVRAHQEFKLEAERELLPFQDGVDGAFVARLKRLP